MTTKEQKLMTSMDLNTFYFYEKLKTVKADAFKRKIEKLNPFIYSHIFKEIATVRKVDNSTYIVYEYDVYNNFYEIHTLTINKEKTDAARVNIRQSEISFLRCFDNEPYKECSTFDELFEL